MNLIESEILVRALERASSSLEEYPEATPDRKGCLALAHFLGALGALVQDPELEARIDKAWKQIRSENQPGSSPGLMRRETATNRKDGD